MRTSLNNIIKAISPINNLYRDPATSPRVKLEALWEMGNRLVEMGVTSPHSTGWSVQKETRGLIKRPTVFRSHKVRTIWPSKEALLKDLGQLQRLSNLTEILPLIDPAQVVRKRLSKEQVDEIYKRACSDSPEKFKQYLGVFKRAYSNGQLGKSLDRSKHLRHLYDIVSDFKALLAYLLKILDQEEPTERDQFRASTSSEELRSFSNMCISLTTKENYRLYKKLEPVIPNSRSPNFHSLYCHFRQILDKVGDVERARLRRLISAEALAQMSDMVSSVISEESVDDYRARRELIISL